MNLSESPVGDKALGKRSVTIRDVLQFCDREIEATKKLSAINDSVKVDKNSLIAAYETVKYFIREGKKTAS